MSAGPAATAAASPWPTAVRVGVAAMEALGGVLVALAWMGARNEVDVERQTSVATLGVAGFACVALGVAAWVLMGRARFEVRLGRIIEAGRAPGGPAAAPLRILPSAAAAAARPAAAPDTVVAAAAMRHYHRPSCVMALGKDVIVASVAVHQGAGRRACEVCTPDE